MRVLLVSANTEQISEPTLPLGLSLVAAATRKAGHEGAFLDLMRQKKGGEAHKRAVEKLHLAIIGISVRNIDDQTMDPARFLLEPVQQLASDCRAVSDAPVVLGGAGCSIFPESALAYLGADTLQPPLSLSSSSLSTSRRISG